MNYIEHTRLFDYRIIYKDINNWTVEFTLELFFSYKIDFIYHVKFLHSLMIFINTP